jgi:hypothetical protein
MANPPPSTPFPAGKRFAFTILDDTDDATVENVGPLYDLLAELGFRTTKTVWPVACPEGSEHFFAGSTLADSDYLEFCLDLQRRGFEITWHGATMESSRRERTIAGLERFRELFGHYPEIHVNHGQNRENLYWGAKRYAFPPLRLLARRGGRSRHHPFDGEEEGSPYFWGDLCKEHCRFIRNFTFAVVDTETADPNGPYRLPSTPWANYWFSTSDAPDAAAFRELVTPERLDRLREAGGYCILSTHLGKGFVRDGAVDPVVAERLRYLSRMEDGWFVPVSQILEHLLARSGRETLSPLARLRLELRHALDRVRHAG